MPDIDELADRALARMASQPDPIRAAANLLMRWAESDSEVADAIPDLMGAYLERRVKARAKAHAGVGK